MRVLSIEPWSLKSAVAPPRLREYGLKEGGNLKKAISCRNLSLNWAACCGHSKDVRISLVLVISLKVFVSSKAIGWWITTFSSTALRRPVLVAPSCSTMSVGPTNICDQVSWSSSPVLNIPKKPRAKQTANLRSSVSSSLPRSPYKTQRGRGGACRGRSIFRQILKRRQGLLSFPRHHGKKWCSPDKQSDTLVIPSPLRKFSSIHSARASSSSWEEASKKGSAW